MVAYVTFTTTEAADRCVYYHKPGGCCEEAGESIIIKGMHTNIVDAPESTDIIWENIGYKNSDINCRTAMSILATLAYVVFSTGILTGLRGSFATVNTGL